MLKDDFCAVGIGQGGGKMANYFYENKYRGFFINTSYDDLSQLRINNDNFIYQPPGSKGCAKIRPVAQQYAKDYYDVMIKKLTDAHTTCGIYLVHYTLGGGTGGGLSNMFMALLRRKLIELGRKNVIIIAIVAKPKSYETYQLQTNAEESLNELYAMSDKGIVDQYYIINNDSRKSLDEINEEHFLLFDRWIEGEKANNKSNADESERMDLFKCKGQAMMFEFDGNDETKFKDNIQKAYDNSIYCKPIKNPAGVGIALNKDIPEEIAIPIIEDVIGVFPKSHVTPTSVSSMIMLGGLKENKSIKNSIIRIANEKAEKMNQSDDTEEEDIKITNINLKSTMQPNSNSDEVGNMDVKDIWDMFK
jgi:cell division GTPase FtsZ